MTTEFDTHTETEVRAKTKTSTPKFYKVILHNDDKTPFEFVIALLMQVFHKQTDEAIQVTFEVHENGTGIAGIYTFEIAEQKRDEAAEISRSQGWPLQITLEEDT